MLQLGVVAPDFSDLKATDGRSYSLRSFDKSPILVVIFSCNHCPYVQAYEDRMIEIQEDYAQKDVQLVAINSNDDRAYPEDSYEKMIERAREKKFNFIYLRDQDQKVVDAYGGVCTPHVFVFDGSRKLRYRGRIDDSRDLTKVKSKDLRNALDDILAQRRVKIPDTKPFGCSIKWMSVPK
ncbi:MAG TPA: thioredoxin family protein [Nitrososphaerales archaeon]|nr:thioredoxin family protein [Nitrososphaerales archaeon]